MALPRHTPRRETAVPWPVSNLPSFTPDTATPLLPSSAPWSLLQQQWQGQGLPLGMDSNCLLIADPETYPHLLMAGTSGSDKTRFGLRPLIASALATCWQVAIYDRSDLDFLPFQGHANAHTVLLEEPAQKIEHISLLCELIQERFITLRQASISTWERRLDRTTGTNSPVTGAENVTPSPLTSSPLHRPPPHLQVAAS